MKLPNGAAPEGSGRGARAQNAMHRENRSRLSKISSNALLLQHFVRIRALSSPLKT